MPLRIAFVGFRHCALKAMHADLAKHPGTWGPSWLAARKMRMRGAGWRGGVSKSPTPITQAMLKEVACDVIACGDYFAKRGARLLAALKAGRHVIGDKPLCSELKELDAIARLAGKKKLKVGLHAGFARPGRSAAPCAE